jgi:sugar phosphate permease
MSASAFAGVIGGPLAGAILTNLNGANGWAGWQWLFLIEGAPSIIAGVVTLFYLTDRPEEANWLSSEERRLIVDDLEQDKRDMGEREHNILASLRDPKLWLLILIFFCIVAANSALTFWGPSAAKDMGFNDSTTVGWIMAAIYLFGGAGMILNGAHSDRSGEARYHCGVAALIGAVAIAVLGFVINTGAVLPLIALAVAIVGTMSAIPVFWQMPNRILSGAAAAAGVAVINSIANLAGFGSPWLIGELRSSTGGLSSGLLAIAAVEAATFLLILRFNEGKPARAGSES